MTKFMEERCNLVKSQQRWFRSRGTSEIAYDRNVRPLILIIFPILWFKRCHPGTVTFTFSRKEICIKDGYQMMVTIGNFKCANLFVVFIDMLYFLEVQVIK